MTKKTAKKLARFGAPLTESGNGIVDECVRRKFPFDLHYQPYGAEKGWYVNVDECYAEHRNNPCEAVALALLAAIKEKEERTSHEARK